MNDAAAVQPVDGQFLEVGEQRPPDGAYYDMPFADYLAVESMSQSGAKKILRSPQHYKLERDKHSEPTDAMVFGTAVHLGVLEPKRFATEVISVPADAPKRPTSAQLKAKKPSPETVEAIRYWQEWDLLLQGKLVFSSPDLDRILCCIEAVVSHPAARYLIDGAKNEVSLFWRDRLYETPCKARLDCMSHGGITDLKTCGDASPEGFSRAIGQYDYAIQAWSNFSGSEHVLNATPTFFAFIAVETEPPYAVAVYQLGRESIMMGARLWDESLARYKRALESGKWEGYSEKIETINAPRWKLRIEP